MQERKKKPFYETPVEDWKHSRALAEREREREKQRVPLKRRNGWNAFKNNFFF